MAAKMRTMASSSSMEVGESWVVDRGSGIGESQEQLRPRLFCGSDREANRIIR